ncbi:hypothetical protein C3E79_01035 [Corynebacterium liangguodongii]|uniref:Uncharacterized protein n=1 Tax=Corynebacterium liangguodongii TaxID=2079535 RepID=A0A2S0WBT5_9CORY|nr:hypothetical protein C3E79_01035 [Corynebacterium liangguodongii]PWB98663.1 hypothetical protein DF219_10575 [Corynebacterium liangguodongii]
MPIAAAAQVVSEIHGSRPPSRQGDLTGVVGEGVANVLAGDLVEPAGEDEFFRPLGIDVRRETIRCHG